MTNWMHRCSYTALFGISILLTGCPLNSKVPLSDPDSALIDKELLGMWRQIPKDKTEDAMLLIVAQFNRTEYLVVARSLNVKEGKKQEEFIVRMFLSKVGKLTYWNFQSLERDLNERTYSFGVYTKSDGEFRLSLVRDKLFKKDVPETSSALAKKFEKFAMHPEFANEDELVFKRLTEQ